MLSPQRTSRYADTTLGAMLDIIEQDVAQDRAKVAIAAASHADPANWATGSYAKLQATQRRLADNLARMSAIRFLLELA